MVNFLAELIVTFNQIKDYYEEPMRSQSICNRTKWSSIWSVIKEVMNKIRWLWGWSLICQLWVWLQKELDNMKSCYQLIITYCYLTVLESSLFVAMVCIMFTFVNGFNLTPNISMHILHTAHHTFLSVLMRRICLTI